MKAVRRPGLASAFFEDDFKAMQGQFEVIEEPNQQRRMWLVCPGCANVLAIAIRPVVDGSDQSWELSGTEELPTLLPSLNHVGCWHGWLRNGEFVVA